jgi:hypothetical protein
MNCPDLTRQAQPGESAESSEPFGYGVHTGGGFLHRLGRLVLYSCLIVLGLVVLSGFGAVVGIGPGCGEDARPSEARAALGAMKDRARVVYQKNPTRKEISFDDLGMGKTELSGSYFSRENFTCGGTPDKWWAQCENVYESEPRYLRIEANLVQGSASFNR